MALENPHFEQSYARVFGDGIAMDERGDAFFDAFYQRFTADPKIAALFTNTDMTRQVQMVKKSLFHLISYYLVGDPAAELERLAHIHRRLPLPSDSFDIWMEALLETVAQFDEEFTELTQLAWCWALAPGIAYMSLAP